MRAPRNPEPPPPPLPHWLRRAGSTQRSREGRGGGAEKKWKGEGRELEGVRPVRGSGPHPRDLLLRRHHHVDVLPGRAGPGSGAAWHWGWQQARAGIDSDPSLSAGIRRSLQDDIEGVNCNNADFNVCILILYYMYIYAHLDHHFFHHLIHGHHVVHGLRRRSLKHSHTLSLFLGFQIERGEGGGGGVQCVYK
jgi:hypothetical protein